MENILELALREAEQAEVYQEVSQLTTVSFQANRLKSIDNCFEGGLGLRIIKDNRIGFSCTTNLEDIKSVVQSAVDSAQFGQKADFRLPGKQKFPQVKCVDSRISSLQIEEMIEQGERAIKLILKEAPSLQCEAELEKSLMKANIINNQGLEYSYDKTVYSFALYAFLAQEGNFLGIEEEEGSCQYQDYWQSLAERIIEAFHWCDQRAKISSGNYPVIFTPKALPLLYSSIGRGINGKIVQKKVSPLGDKINQLVLSSLLNIQDDATISYALASSPMDGEGVPSRSTCIIEEGKLKNFIFDLQTASLMGTETTANGKRGFDSLPSPSVSNIIIKEGRVSFAEMLGEIKEGLIIDQIIGSGQGNALMGDFSVNLDLGYKVEKGKIKGRIKDLMITGNAYDLLKNVKAVGKESRSVGAVRTPHLFFPKISVSG